MEVHGGKETESVILYGELFGGIYPGEESVKRTPPQAGIFYSPRLEFMIFDVAYMTDRDENPVQYMAYDKVVELAEKYNVLHAKPLLITENGVGECLAFNHRFTSLIGAQLGYKEPTEMPDKNPQNLAEGVVIKPWDVETEGGDERPVLKNKIEEFQESDGFQPQKKVKNKDNGQDNEFEKHALSTVNSNRVDAAISKIGDDCLVDMSLDIAPLFNEIMSDIRTEIEIEDNDKIVGKLANLIRKEINMASRTRLMKLHDGKLPKDAWKFRNENADAQQKKK